MQYNQLGKSGLRVSEFSFGSWLTFANDIDAKKAEKCMHYAFEQGVNFFDNAEVYAEGQSEIVMGQALKSFKREDLVISTKLYWGGDGPNDTSLSRKHLLEGAKNSLKRMGLDYVDLLFCHRPDFKTPVEETVLAMDYLVRNGYALYWGTSEWPADRIQTAFEVAKEYNCIAPTMEQPQYNIFHRERVEVEYKPLYEKYSLGTTIWSPLASGVLTGKYSKGIPKDSRIMKAPQFKPEHFDRNVTKAIQLESIAESLSCSLTQMSLAWCLKNPHVSTVILGASKVEQLEENLGALQVKDKLTKEVMAKIEQAVT